MQNGLIEATLSNSTLRAYTNSFAAKKGFAVLGSNGFGLSDWDNIRISNETTDKSDSADIHAAFRNQIIIVLCLLMQISIAKCQQHA